jgi:hypothetical protein
MGDDALAKLTRKQFEDAGCEDLSTDVMAVLNDAALAKFYLVYYV